MLEVGESLTSLNENSELLRKNECVLKVEHLYYKKGCELSDVTSDVTKNEKLLEVYGDLHDGETSSTRKGTIYSFK